MPQIRPARTAKITSEFYNKNIIHNFIKEINKEIRRASKKGKFHISINVPDVLSEEQLNYILEELKTVGYTTNYTYTCYKNIVIYWQNADLKSPY